MKMKSLAEIKLHDCWKLIEQGKVTVKDLTKLEEAFTKALIQIERLTKSRDNWRKKYEACNKNTRDQS